MLIPHTAKHLFASACADGAYTNCAHMLMLAQESYEMQWEERLPHKELQLPDADYFAMVSTIMHTRLTCTYHLR
jgi:hypothetical protein